jgi:hypothetical protein
MRSIRFNFPRLRNEFGNLKFQYTFGFAISVIAQAELIFIWTDRTIVIRMWASLRSDDKDFEPEYQARNAGGLVCDKNFEAILQKIKGI